MNPPSAPAGIAADAWDVLDQLVEDVARLSRGAPPIEAFAHELLRRAVDALAAQGAAYWSVEDDRFTLRAAYPDAPTPELALLAASPPAAAHLPLLQWIVRTGEAIDAAPRARVAATDDAANPLDAVLLAAPVIVDRAPVGVLELVPRCEVGPDVRRGTLQWLQTLADVAADYHRERQRRFWRERAASTAEFERLAVALYAELDSSAVAFAAANEGRRWSGCDRVSVVLCTDPRRGGRALAVSGVGGVDRRSDLVRALERFAADAVRHGEPWYHGERNAETPPTLAESLTTYIDLSAATALAVFPLIDRPPSDATTSANDRPLGAILVERFQGSTAFDDAARDRLESLADHAARALARARECESIPFGGAWRRWYRRSRPAVRRWSRVAVYAALAATAAIAPFFIPARATVEARGSLQPAERRELFAPTDGVVSEIAVRHGQVVKAGDVLVVLRRPELTVELARVAGEIQAAESRLAAVRAARIVTNPTNPTDRAQAQERSAEEEQLKQTLQAAAAERKLLLEQVDDLTVRAPLAGVVTTWDVDRVLAGRPVARGQTLLELADMDGAWVVELAVPDRLLGELTAARQTQSEPLEVEFVTATHPEATHRGRLLRTADAVEFDAERGPVVQAVVSLDRRTIDAAQLRPGAVVSARIVCGPSNAGAVYTRDLRRFIQSWWW